MRIRPFESSVLALILILFMASCAAIPSPTPTSTSAPTLTSTVTLTPLPSATPTNSPPKDGDTKLENGETFIYKIIQSSDSQGQQYSGWFRKLTPTAIPVYDWSEIGSPGGKDIGPMVVYVQEGVSGADGIKSITHPVLTLSDARNSTYEHFMDGKLNEDYYHPKCCASHTYTATQLAPFFGSLQSGTMDYTFTNGSQKYPWYLGPKSGSVVYVIDFDKATPEKSNGFLEWRDLPNQIRFRSVFWGVDEQGNILGAISSEKSLDQLDDTELRLMVLYHITAVLDEKDVTDYGFGVLPEMMSEQAGKDKPPYIQIQREP